MNWLSNPRPVFVAVPLLVCCVFADADRNFVQVGRYIAVSSKPDAQQLDLLSRMVSVQFDKTSKTVGAAVEELLQPTGYRLSPDQTATKERQELLALPLPSLHRSLGPLTLRDMLQVLAGPGWSLVEDPVSRQVSFERCEVPK